MTSTRTTAGKIVHYSGRVQGVGFRYTVKQIAGGYDIRGSVRNLPDGRVELLATGEPEELEAFLAAIRESSLGGLIREMQEAPLDPVPAIKGFEIR